MLHPFPFRILGFHSDNGSEYVNHEVAKMLKSLLIEFTKSRFATESLDARGKRRRRYPREDYATPYEKLKSLEKAEQSLKPNLSWAQLDQVAQKMSDTRQDRIAPSSAKLTSVEGPAKDHDGSLSQTQKPKKGGSFLD